LIFLPDSTSQILPSHVNYSFLIVYKQVSQYLCAKESKRWVLFYKTLQSLSSPLIYKFTDDGLLAPYRVISLFSIKIQEKQDVIKLTIKQESQANVYDSQYIQDSSYGSPSSVSATPPRC
jgi:hypothetical protein